MRGAGLKTMWRGTWLEPGHAIMAGALAQPPPDSIVRQIDYFIAREAKPLVAVVRLGFEIPSG
jgi:hypothetical protein